MITTIANLSLLVPSYATDQAVTKKLPGGAYQLGQVCTIEPFSQGVPWKAGRDLRTFFTRSPDGKTTLTLKILPVIKGDDERQSTVSENLVAASKRWVDAQTARSMLEVKRRPKEAHLVVGRLDLDSSDRGFVCAGRFHKDHSYIFTMDTTDKGALSDLQRCVMTLRRFGDAPDESIPADVVVGVKERLTAIRKALMSDNAEDLVKAVYAPGTLDFIKANSELWQQFQEELDQKKNYWREWLHRCEWEFAIYSSQSDTLRFPSSFTFEKTPSGWRTNQGIIMPVRAKR
ncbi:MAG: hypothetical protein MI861_01990 [Pirellulales bacterium]|nr:hypothetical protein [Pirellulales bacterium]